MATLFDIQLFIPTGYDRITGWQYSEKPNEIYPFDTAPAANAYYDDKLKQIAEIAVLNSSAIQLLLSRDTDNLPSETQRVFIYDGENVRFWFAAYHEPGPSVFEERYYIQRIYFDIGYYTFMKPKADDLREVIAAAQTIEELKQILGDEFELYDLPTE